MERLSSQMWVPERGLLGSREKWSCSSFRFYYLAMVARSVTLGCTPPVAVGYRLRGQARMSVLFGKRRFRAVGFWATHLIPIILLLIGAAIAETMNVLASDKKVTWVVPIVIFATATVWSLFVYRWYVALALPVVFFILMAIFEDLMRAARRRKQTVAPPAEAPPPMDQAGPQKGMRERLLRLERAKDSILDLLNSRSQTDEGKTVAGDAKEVYYGVFAAFQMLTRREPSRERMDSAGIILGGARGRLEQVAGKLKTLEDKQAAQLGAELGEAFEDCWQKLSGMLPAAPPTTYHAPSNWSAFFELPVNLSGPAEKEHAKPLDKKVIKVNERRYELPCSVCGETAVVWEIGIFKLGAVAMEEKESLLYHGIVMGTQFDLTHASKIFDWLDHEQIGKVHAWTLEREMLECGIDAYCPKCDSIFCARHYQKVTEWDGSWYDCTYGTCPQGHRRIIDD